MTPHSFDVDGKIAPLFDQYFTNFSGIELISLATTDGFNVYCKKLDTYSFETDKLSAASSTLYSVCDAVTRQILGKKFEVTFIETGAGNVVCIALSTSSGDYVLTMSGSKEMNIASLRLAIKRLAEEVKN